eukprot:3603817-Prymnesium_polylepis.1
MKTSPKDKFAIPTTCASTWSTGRVLCAWRGVRMRGPWGWLVFAWVARSKSRRGVRSAVFNLTSRGSKNHRRCYPSHVC